MIIEPIEGYSEFLDDPTMFASDTGVLANVLGSVSRQISACYNNTRIPGSDYVGADVFITSTLNPNTGYARIGNEQQRISIGLSIPETSFVWLNHNYFELHITVDAVVGFPRPPQSTSAVETLIADAKFRDLRMRLAVIDALYMAMLHVPYYQGKVPTGIPLIGTEMAHSGTMDIHLTCTYVANAQVKVGEGGKPEKLTIIASIDGSREDVVGFDIDESVREQPIQR